jgi:pilus assembly protein Flp/PilA
MGVPIVMRKHFARFVKNEDGAALVEYGLLVGLIAVVCIAAVTALGKQIDNVFCTIVNDIAAAIPALPAEACPIAG